MLYNPNTVKPFALVEGICDVTNDTFVKFHVRRAKSSFEEAIAQDCSGHVYWLDGDKVYRAHLTPAASWTPLTEDGYEVPGINWGTKYFLTKEAAAKFRADRLEAGYYQTDCPHYHEDGDIWSVHYHYEYG